MTEPKTHKFKAEVSQVLSLVINSLYSNKDVFVRELVSNAADALDKLRFRSIENPKLIPPNHTPRIRLIPDEAARTLTLWDNGIGMSEAALTKDLGTVARSGSKEFIEKLQQAQKDSSKRPEAAPQLIGQFGVGFYSGYLVADRIEVTSRAAGSKKAHRWSSDGKESFELAPAERDEIGTTIVLHLKQEHASYANEDTLRDLVRRYSDFIDHTIELGVRKDDELTFEAVNTGSALWMRAPKDISDEQYDEFYKHLTHDWEPPLARTHFAVEGTQMFTGLLFVPKRPPFDLSNPEVKHGVRLYVRRVFIMDNCEELLPRWLRFVRGVVDSDDLPLNVSRELLQSSAVVDTIRKQVVRRVLDMLGKLAKDRHEEYLEFWPQFGGVIKEGLYFDSDQRDKLGKLLRYDSSADGGLTSLADYVGRMKEDQDAIYYALGPSREMLTASPHLEGLKKRDFEVLYMTDAVDQWAVEGLTEYDGKTLVSAMEADLSLDAKSEGKDADDDEKDAADLQPLLKRCQQILETHVSEVRISQRLTDSPVCLVMPKGGLPAHLERLIRAHQQDLPIQKRILELNPEHALIQRLRAEYEKGPDSERLTEWVELLHDQALLAEGSPLPDPAKFASRFAGLMERATQ